MRARCLGTDSIKSMGLLLPLDVVCLNLACVHNQRIAYQHKPVNAPLKPMIKAICKPCIGIFIQHSQATASYVPGPAA